jgi:hypothetical protein
VTRPTRRSGASYGEETEGARLVAEEVNSMEMRSTPLAPFALFVGLCGRHKEMDDATKRQGSTRL